MTNEQLYVALGGQMFIGAVVVGLLIAVLNSKAEALKSEFQAVSARYEAKLDTVEAKFDAKLDTIEAKFHLVDAKFDGVYRRFDALEAKFDALASIWRAELRRVEDIIDARLKHLEERS